MSETTNTNLVHEAEAQRQHARITLPANLRITLQDGETHLLPITDLSAGGFRLETSSVDLKLNSQQNASIVFNIDSLEFQLNISFLVKSNDKEGFLGCEFQNLSSQDISTLRFMITSYLSGELVSMGDVINTLSRQNFTKSRNGKAGLNQMSSFARARSIIISLIIFIVGLCAMGFIVNKLYSSYFITRSDTASIKVDTIEVRMPRDGILHSLIPADGKVAKGAPIASYETAMLDVLKGHLGSDDLTKNNISSLFKQSLSGTISSPCDCILQRQIVPNGYFAPKGNALFELVPANVELYIEATFDFKYNQKIIQGKTVEIQVPGEDSLITGIIKEVNISNSGRSIVTIIQPSEPIKSQYNGRPVSVMITQDIGE